MTITTEDQLLNALANNASRIVIDKASLSSTAAGQIFSLWRATGTPGQGAIPTTPAIPTNATAGAMGFTQQTAPATSYLGWLRLTTSNATQSVEIHDRVAHMGGLSGTVTTAQAVNMDLGPAGLNLEEARRGDANYSDIQWWIEVYVDLGATNVNATVAVTYDDGSTGNLAVITLGSSPRVGRLYPLAPAVPGRFIRAVNTVTLSATTGAVGNFGITATRPRTGIDVLAANSGTALDWRLLGLPEVPNNSCLVLLTQVSTTTTGTIRGMGRIAHG